MYVNGKNLQCIYINVNGKNLQVLNAIAAEQGHFG